MLPAAILLGSCRKNIGTIQQTYIKAIAQYEDINLLRKSAIITPPRNITNTGKIFYGETFLLIGEKNKGIHLINNANPKFPGPVSFLDLPYTNEFYVHNNILYAVSHYDIIKIDITNISNPVILGRLNNAFGPFVKDANGNILVGFTFQKVTEQFELGSEEEQALRINNTLYYDYQDKVIPFSQVPSSFIGSSVKNKGTLNRIAFSNNNLFIIGNDDIHSFIDNGTQFSKGTRKVIGEELETIYVHKNHLFVGTTSEMIILTNSVSPTVVSRYEHQVTCDPVLPNDDVAYLTLRSTSENGCNGSINVLEVVDISNLNNPIGVASVDMESPYGMAILGNYLFIAQGNNGLKVMDITLPKSPVLFANYPSIRGFDVLRHPSVANGILITGNNGFKQYSFDSTTGGLEELSSISAP